MRKPAFCNFYGLCILTPFSLLTFTVQGISYISIAYRLFHCYFVVLFDDSHITSNITYFSLVLGGGILL